MTDRKTGRPSKTVRQRRGSRRNGITRITRDGLTPRRTRSHLTPRLKQIGAKDLPTTQAVQTPEITLTRRSRCRTRADRRRTLTPTPRAPLKGGQTCTKPPTEPTNVERTGGLPRSGAGPRDRPVPKETHEHVQSTRKPRRAKTTRIPATAPPSKTASPTQMQKDTRPKQHRLTTARLRLPHPTAGERGATAAQETAAQATGKKAASAQRKTW